MAALLAPPSRLAAQGTVLPSTTSARTLGNGLRVWLHPVANDPMVDVMMVVAGGASLDPRGKEELAHFTEHIAFGDRPGLTEQALNAQVQSLGGTITANTSFDRTMYRVTLPATHAAAAIDWMARVVSPRTVSPALLQQQLPPILLELGASPRSTAQRLLALYRDPAWLRRASPWKRDFGFETFADRDYDAYHSLHRITSDDVQAFMERTYVASNMTLVVAGGLDSAAIAGANAAIDRAFSAFPTRPAPSRPLARALATSPSATIWTPRGTATYVRSLRGHGLHADDRALVLFLRDYLDRRLNDRLRYGDAKLVYHPSVSLALLGDAAVLTVAVASTASQLAAVRAVVDDELSRVRSGSSQSTATDSAFRADRDAIATATALGLKGREAFVEAARSHFFVNTPEEPAPEMAALQGAVTPARLSSVMRDRFPVARETWRLQRPVPTAFALLGLLALAMAWGTRRFLRRRLIVPVDMRTLRYAARLRIDALVALTLLLTVGVAVAVGARVAAGLAPLALERLVFPLPGVLQLTSYALALVVAVALAILLLSFIPRKLLVFDDHVRLKYLAYRSVVIPSTDIAECRIAGRGEGWTLAGFLRGWALTLGLRRGALLIRLRNGRTLLVRTRDTAELHAAIAALRQPAIAARP